MHDSITVGIPVLVILFGILLNQRGLERLDLRIDKWEAHIDASFNHMEAFDRIEAGISQAYGTLGVRHE